MRFLCFFFALLGVLVAQSYGDEELVRVIRPNDKVTYGVHLEPRHRVQKRAMDQPIRIFKYYDSTVETGLSDNIELKVKNIIEKISIFLSDALQVKATGTPILLDRSCPGNTFFIVNGQTFCDGSCAVTMCGLTTVPDDHLQACRRCTGSTINTCGTVGSDGPGVSNTDYILYVSAVMDSNCGTGGSGTVAFASHCQLESALDRPIAGYVNFCPSAFTSDASDDFIFDVAKHEIHHALGFTSSLYALWRDESGDPRTPRESDGFPPVDTQLGVYQWSDSTVKQVVYNDWQTINGVLSHSVRMLVTPNVVAEARDHFGCPTLEGVELENQGGSGTAISHWEKRILGYFGSLNDGGRVQEADFCPFNQKFSNGECQQERGLGGNNIYAETYGTTSRCVDHGSVWTVTIGSTKSTASIWGAGCYEVFCPNGTNEVIVNILGQNFTCSSEGETVTVDRTVGGSRHQGSFICPSYDSVCEFQFDYFQDPSGIPTQPTTEPDGAPTMLPSILLLALPVLLGAVLA